MLDVGLHVDETARDLELGHGDGRRVIVLQEAVLPRIQEEQRASDAVAVARYPRHPQYVLGGVVGGLELDDPVHGGGDVEIPSRRVGRAQYPLVLVAELEEPRDELLPTLISMHGHRGHVQPPEKLGVILGRIRCREEDHDLLVQILLQEGEEEAKAQALGTGNEGVIVGLVYGRVDGDDGAVVVHGLGQVVAALVAGDELPAGAPVGVEALDAPVLVAGDEGARLLGVGHILLVLPHRRRRPRVGGPPGRIVLGTADRQRPCHGRGHADPLAPATAARTVGGGRGIRRR
mmetsp:Transcript_39767/g.95693  ORF Transcript_39767/g.95693 Transcript_39767/m.95693 type:complete len:290 (-) Transcript_39767:1446-2315(-)